jgi:hypothetical protein
MLPTTLSSPAALLGIPDGNDTVIIAPGVDTGTFTGTLKTTPLPSTWVMFLVA